MKNITYSGNILSKVSIFTLLIRYRGHGHSVTPLLDMAFGWTNVFNDQKNPFKFRLINIYLSEK